jgi:SAM-dependent methyltransferase
LSSGYFCDIDYIDYFYEGLSPWFMDYLAALRGFPRLAAEDGFDYCELGCGTGLSLVVHAAANPGGRFVGVDLNRDHIRRATATAKAGQVANVTFLEEDFAGLLERELPRFDVIALHGVYSWVSPGIRKEIQGFIAHRLKPGGKVYVSYNALPGWSQQIPIRDLMLAHVDGRGGATLDRVAEGIGHLRRFRDAGAAVLQAGPQVQALVDHILAADPRYVAHEYFTPYFEAFYFKQVHTDMTRVGLTYLGCLPAALNYGGFCLPQALQDYFQGLPDRPAFETHKDLVLNTVFRRDVYCLGQERPAGTAAGRLAGVTLGSLRAGEDFTFQFEAKANVIQLDGPIYRRLAGILGNRRLPAEAILAHPDLAGTPPGEIVQGLECLVASGQVLPCAPGPAAAGPGLSPLNRHLLERDVLAGPVTVACPGYGTGVTLAQADALLVLGVQGAGTEGAAAWVQDWAREHGLELAAQEGAAPLAEQMRERARHLPLDALGLSGEPPA